MVSAAGAWAATEHSRSELGDFLKSKRKSLRPADFGLCPSSTRRTTGLRREEVAEFASVGFTWYTWLEQGRDIHPSEDVLRRLTAVLQLNEIESRYVRTLCGRADRTSETAVSESGCPLQGVVDGVTFPACVRNACYDVLSWNEPFETLFGFRHGDSALERNFLWRLFAGRWPAIEIERWPEVARMFSADLRLHYGQSSRPEQFETIVTELRSQSTLFETWWKTFIIGEFDEVSITTVDREHGRQLWKWQHFEVLRPTELSVVVMAPTPLS
jgi:PAS domain-containing protein